MCHWPILSFGTLKLHFPFGVTPQATEAKLSVTHTSTTLHACCISFAVILIPQYLLLCIPNVYDPRFTSQQQWPSLVKPSKAPQKMQLPALRYTPPAVQHLFVPLAKNFILWGTLQRPLGCISRKSTAQVKRNKPSPILLGWVGWPHPVPPHQTHQTPQRILEESVTGCASTLTHIQASCHPEDTESVSGTLRHTQGSPQSHQIWSSSCSVPCSPSQSQPLAPLTIGTFHGSPKGHVDTDHGRAHPAGDLGTWRIWGLTHSSRSQSTRKAECSQLPLPGYLIDSSNHPRWVDTLKSNQSLREPVAGDCHCCHGNATWPDPGHSGPSSALEGWGHLSQREGTLVPPQPTLQLDGKGLAR